jgi:hypothetical protein
MASLLAPLVLAGLILMHGLDAEAARSVTDTGVAEHATGDPTGDVAGTQAGSRTGRAAGDEMVAAANAAHVEKAPGGDHGEHGCHGCHLAGHMTAVCVAALVSVALWRVGRVRLGEAGAEQPAPGRPRRAATSSPVPRGQPAWLELSVILR